VEVLFGGGGDDMVVVGHEDDVVDEKVISFNGLLKGPEHDTGDLPLIEPTGPVVSAADQVIG